MKESRLITSISLAPIYVQPQSCVLVTWECYLLDNWTPPFGPLPLYLSFSTFFLSQPSSESLLQSPSFPSSLHLSLILTQFSP